MSGILVDKAGKQARNRNNVLSELEKLGMLNNLKDPRSQQ
jgi:hypothetical protein